MLETVKTVFPKGPKPTFIPNQRVMIAEDPSFFYGLDEVDWPAPIRTITTRGVRVPRPVFPSYDMGGVDDEYAASLDPTLEQLAMGDMGGLYDDVDGKSLALGAVIGGAFTWWLCRRMR